MLIFKSTRNLCLSLNFQKQAQLKELRSQLAREIEHHEQQQKNHADVIARHKKRIEELSHEEKNLK